MALLHSTFFYISLPWHYFTLHHPTMALLYSSLLYWLYFTLLDSTLLYHGSTLLYITLPWLYHDSTLPKDGSTSLYFSLHYSTMALLDSTLLYITLPWLYLTLPDSTLLYVINLPLVHFTLRCIQWLYFTLLY